MDIKITCLTSAEDLSLDKLIDEHKKVIIDFWTTPCTRCPAALDNLNEKAESAEFEDYKIISINCGNDVFHCDDARNIIEAPKEKRWDNISHYYAALEQKEIAKAYFGFSQVPFYVAICDGKVVSSGTKKTFDFYALPGVAAKSINRTSSPTCVTHDTLGMMGGKFVNTVKVVDAVVEEELAPAMDTFSFSMDEDF